MIYRDQCRANDEPCWICGHAIDYNARDPDPLSFTKDHYWPKSIRPDLKYHVSNFRPAHKICNHRRGNRLPDETHWVGDPVDGVWWQPLSTHSPQPEAPDELLTPQAYADLTRKRRKSKRHNQKQVARLHQTISEHKGGSWAQLLRDHSPEE